MIGHYFLLLLPYSFLFLPFFPFFLEGTIPPVWNGFLAWPCERRRVLRRVGRAVRDDGQRRSNLGGHALGAPRGGGIGEQAPLANWFALANENLLVLLSTSTEWERLPWAAQEQQ